MRTLIPPPQIYAALCLAGLFTLGCSGGSGSGSATPATPATPAAVAPAITSQPQNQVAVAGASATFSVTATGTPAPTYQWQMAGAPIQGQTAAQLVLNNLAAANEGSYQVVVTNSAGTVTSSPATLSVNRPPTFSQQPASQTVTAPAAASFSVILDAEPAPALQWQTSTDGNTWTNLAGATATTVSSGPTSSAGNGLQYRCQASNTLGTANSTAATLTVNSAAPPTPPPAGSFSLGVTLGAGTTGTPASTANYTAGTAVSYAYTAAAGYQGLQVTLDGAAAPASGTVTMNASHALAVTASPIPVATYTVSFVAGSGGTLAGTAAQTVTAGASTSAVTAVADSGSSFQNWTGSGFTTSTSNPLTVTNVQQDLTITANFSSLPASFPVTFTAGQGGSITGSASQTVVAGASASAVTAVPATGYVFSNWTGTGFTTSTANPLTVADVQGALNITANFTSSNPTGNQVGDTPIDIDFVDATGNVSHLSDHQGKVILLVCSEFYCNPCQQESLILQGLANTYGPQGVVILENLSNVGTNVVTAAELTEWATNASITTVPVLHDSNDLPTLYALTAFPTNILIGKDYTIRAIQSGYNQAEVTAMITDGLQ